MIYQDIFRALQTTKRHTPQPIQRFSIEKVGTKYYVYAHLKSAVSQKKTIGRYDCYTQARTAVNQLLDLRLESYGS